MAIASRRVDAGSGRCSADAEGAKLDRCFPEEARGAACGGGVGAELLAQRDRRGVLQMRAAGLDDVREFIAFVVEGIGERVELGQELIEQQERGDADRGREDVIRRLRHVDVIVRMYARPGEIRDHLVHVHVERRAGAGLKDIDDEVLLIVLEISEELVARANDRVAGVVIHRAEVAIGQRGGLLQVNECADERRMLAQPADRIVLHRALRLRAPKRVIGDRDLTEGVSFDSHRFAS